MKQREEQNADQEALQREIERWKQKKKEGKKESVRAEERAELMKGPRHLRERFMHSRNGHGRRFSEARGQRAALAAAEIDISLPPSAGNRGQQRAATAHARTRSLSSQPLRNRSSSLHWGGFRFMEHQSRLLPHSTFLPYFRIITTTITRFLSFLFCPLGYVFCVGLFYVSFFAFLVFCLLSGVHVCRASFVERRVCALRTRSPRTHPRGV